MAITRKSDPTDADGYRDLEFRPADPAAATTLTPEQVEHFNREGYVSGIDVFTPDEADEIREYFDWLLDEVVNADDARNSYSINTYHLVCEPLYDLVVNERIVSLITDIVGREAVCWGSHLFAKLPGDPKAVPFHQDGIYWPLTPSKSVTVWLAIDDVDVDNGAMQFVPGTHDMGSLEHRQFDLDGTRVLGREVADIEQFGDRRFTNELKAGQCSLHSDMLLHGSAPNTSDRRRAGMTLRYAAADVRLIDGYEFWKKPAVHVADGDPSGFWYDRKRPEGSHPELMAQVWGEFDGTPIDAS